MRIKSSKSNSKFIKNGNKIATKSIFVLMWNYQTHDIAHSVLLLSIFIFCSQNNSFFFVDYGSPVKYSTRIYWPFEKLWPKKTRNNYQNNHKKRRKQTKIWNFLETKLICKCSSNFFFLFNFKFLFWNHKIA